MANIFIGVAVFFFGLGMLMLAQFHKAKGTTDYSRFWTVFDFIASGFFAAMAF